MLLHLNTLPVDVAAPVFEAMENARQAGKKRAFGWSTDYPSSVATMADMDGFAAVEHAMNVFVDVPAIQKKVCDHDLVALTRSPQAMGLLAGKCDAASEIP